MSGPTSPKVALNQAQHQAHEIVAAVKQLQLQQEEAERRAQKEIKAHADAKQKIKNMESEYFSTKQAAEDEAENHLQSKEKLEKEERFHAKTRDALRNAAEDVSSMRMQMDALKVEMEAQRKAFVINVNWAARCTELKTKYDQSCNDADQLFDQHVKAKTEMSVCLRATDQFKAKHQAALEAHAIVQEDLAKLADEVASKSALTADIANKMAELDEWSAKKQQEMLQKKLGSQQALSVLQRSLAKGEEGIKTSSFAGWCTIAKEEKKKRIQKDKVMSRATKMIATEGWAVVVEMFKEWQGEWDRSKRAALVAATKRLEEMNGSSGAGSKIGRERAIAQLEKQFVGENTYLVKSCFQGWASGQIARKKKDQNHKKASRMIANSGMGLVAEVFSLWNDLTEKRRKKNRQHQANIKSAGRLIANSTRMLITDVFNSWYSFIAAIRRKRKTDEAGTAKAMRMMANSAQAVLNLCFDSWAKLQRAKKQKDAGNSKCLRMIADSAQALVVAVWTAWASDLKNGKAKEANTARAVRMISSSGEALQASVFQSWSRDISKNRDRNKKIRALEKSFGAQDLGLKMVIFTGWQGIAKIEGRKKKHKQHSMKTAIKSITGNADLLLCHLILAWGRYASFSKVEKLEELVRFKGTQFDEAVAKARSLIEGDLLLAQDNVRKAEAGLEEAKKTRDAALKKNEEIKGRLDNDMWYAMREVDVQITSVSNELENSRGKASLIGEELGKVGVYISSHAPRKTSRSGSAGGSRPASGNKAAVPDQLPRIDGSNSRPRPGSGSKTARGVAGERSGSGRSDGRPPRNPEDGVQRRYLTDGRGPYTYAQFLEIFDGADNAIPQWNAGAPEVPAGSYGDY